MDYWEYIAHSQKGAERENHRYYAREQVGTNRFGLPKYRYFYSAEEYSAYKNGQRGEKHQQRIVRAKAEQVQKDAAAYRQKRQEAQDRAAKRASNRNKRIGEQHSMDRSRWEREARENARTARGEKHAQRVTSAIAEKVQKDAERYRSKRIGEQHSADRKRWDTEARAAQVKKDAEAYRKKRRNTAKSKRIGEQHSMDMKRYASEARENARTARSEKHAQRVTEARAAQVKKDAMAYRSKRRKAQKVQMDAERYRKQRRAENTEKRNEWKRSVDRKRTQTSIHAQKVQMDAKNYRRKKRAAAKSRRDFQKRVMDNTRTRKSYQPKMV